MSATEIRLRSLICASVRPVARRARRTSEIVSRDDELATTANDSRYAFRPSVFIGNSGCNLNRSCGGLFARAELRLLRSHTFRPTRDELPHDGRGFRSAESDQRLGKRLERWVCREIEGSQRTGDHEPQASGRSKFRCRIKPWKQGIEELGGAGNAPTACRHWALDEDAARWRQPDHVSRRHAGSFTGRNLGGELANDGYNFEGTEANASRSKIRQ